MNLSLYAVGMIAQICAGTAEVGTANTHSCAEVVWDCYKTIGTKECIAKEHRLYLIAANQKECIRSHGMCYGRVGKDPKCTDDCMERDMWWWRNKK